MASVQRKGAAEIEYDPASGPAVVHLLAVPLLVSPAAGFQSVRRRVMWSRWNADNTIREAFVLGEAVDEIIGTVRFDDQPAELRELIRSGLEDDVDLIYRPYGPSGEDFTCKLVGQPGAAEGEIILTPDRVGFREYTAQLWLRRVDGGNWESLLNGGAAS
jgi:hypothetical protein